MPSTQDGYVEREVEIRNAEGLHMRPAMQFVDCASRFVSRVSVCKGAQSVDGKSIMQMTMLAANQGTRLKIIAAGPDAEQAVDALARIIENQTSENTG